MQKLFGILTYNFILIFLYFIQLQPAKSNTDHIIRVGDNSTLIRAVSVDRQYATFASHSSIASNSFTFNQYDFNLRTLYTLQTNVSCLTKNIQQVKNYNNLTTNKYAITHPYNSFLFLTNFTTLNLSWVPTGNQSYEAVFGGSGGFIYQASSNVTCVNLTQRNTTSRQIARNFQYPSEVFLSLGFYTSRILLLTAPTANASQLILRVYDNKNMTLNWTVFLAVANNSANIRMSVSSSYVGISDGYNLRILTCATNFTHFWNITISQPISDLQIVNSSYVIVATNASIMQYNISNQFLMSSALSPQVSAELNSGIFNGLFWLVVWKVDYAYLDVFSLSNSYVCLGCQNCTCLAGYCFNSAFDRCQRVGTGVACVNTFNMSNCVQPTVPSPTPIPGVVTPIVIPSIIQDPTSICLSENNEGECEKYCSYSCNYCYISTSTCVSCSNYHQMRDGQCKMTKLNMALFAAASILNIFRHRQFQRIYFLVDDLKFHSYHKTNYTGIVKDITDFMIILQKNFWTIINQGTILGWFSEPWPVSTYSSYTNSRFEQIERSDSFFLQNTKNYLVVYIPILTIVFVAFNRLFYLFFQYRISVFFRIFSFWFSLIMFIIIQNATMLTFLACHHFTHMFSFDYMTRFLQSATVVFIGVSLVLALSFFFNCQYLYGKSSKNFLSNMNSHQQSYFLMFKHFIARPVLQTIIHAYFYQIPYIQLPLLAMIQFTSLLILLKAQYQENLFKLKLQFIGDCLIDFSLALLNLILYFQYYVYFELNEIFQYCLTVIIYFNASLIILFAIYTLIYSFLKKQPKKIVKNKIKRLLSEQNILAIILPQKQGKSSFKNQIINQIKIQQKEDFDHSKQKQPDFI